MGKDNDTTQAHEAAASRLPALRVRGQVDTRAPEPTPDEDAPKVGEALRRQWRPIIPLPVTAGVWALGGMLHQASAGVEIALIGGAAATVGGLVAAWRKLPDRRDRLWAACAIGGGWGGVLSTAAFGAGPPWAGFVFAAGAALAMPWWWRHCGPQVQEPEPQPVPEPEPAAPEPERDVEAERITQTWTETVSTSRGALAKSRLGPPVPFQYGRRATIALDRGVHVTADAIAATGKILSAYGAAPGEVYIDAHPSRKQDQAMLVVLTTNPLRAKNLWTGPTLDKATGISVIGPYADGAQTRYRWWSDIGPIHDLIAGTSGSGKSGLVNQLLAEERHSGFMTSVFIDPQQGQSAPDWPQNVHRFAGDAETGTELLQAVEQAMYARNEFLANREWVDGKGRRRRGVNKWTLGCGLPLMVVTIEEAHAVLDDPVAAQSVERIAKMARKCGIKLRLIVQDPSVGQLGNSRVLRSQLTGGNVIVLRTGDRLGGQIATGGRLPVDPYDIPAEWPDGGGSTAGCGYLIGAENRGAMLRVSHVDDPYGWATSGTPCPEHPVDTAAFGEIGRPGAPVRRPAPQQQPAAAVAALPDLAHAAQLNPAISQMAKALTGLGQVIPMSRRHQPVPEPVPQTVVNRVPELLGDGNWWRTVDLTAAIGCSDRQVRTVLAQLALDGRIEQTGEGPARRHRLRQHSNQQAS